MTTFTKQYSNPGFGNFIERRIEGADVATWINPKLTLATQFSTGYTYPLRGAFAGRIENPEILTQFVSQYVGLSNSATNFYHVFNATTNIGDLTFNEAVSNIAPNKFSYAFTKAQIDRIAFPNLQDGTTIGSSAFYFATYEGSIGQFDINFNKISSIGESAFYAAFQGVKNLSEFSIGTGTISTTLANNAFNRAFHACSSLESVTIGPNLYLSSSWHFYSAFCRCSNLKTVSIDLHNTGFYSTYHSGFFDYAFMTCPNLETVNIVMPPSKMLSPLFVEAFSNCSTIKNANIAFTGAASGYNLSDTFRDTIIDNLVIDCTGASYLSNGYNPEYSVGFNFVSAVNSMTVKMSMRTGLSFMRTPMPPITTPSSAGTPKRFGTIAVTGYTSVQTLPNLGPGHVTNGNQYSPTVGTDMYTQIGELAYPGLEAIGTSTYYNEYVMHSSAYANVGKLTFPDLIFIRQSGLYSYSRGIISPQYKGKVDTVELGIPYIGTSIEYNGTTYSSCGGISSAFMDISTVRKVAFPRLSGLFINATNAFKNCTGLEEVDFGALESMNGYSAVFSGAFSGCTSLKSINFSNIPYMTGNVFESAFQNLPALETLRFDRLNISGGYRCFANAFQNCTKLKSITFPGCISSLGNAVFTGAFVGCSALEEVNLPNVRLLGMSNFSNAFQNCRNLRVLNLPNVSSCGMMEFYSAFTNCYSLESFNLPAGVNLNACNSAFTYAFNNCSALSTFNVPMLTDPYTNNKQVGYMVFASAFTNCYNLKSFSPFSEMVMGGYQAFLNAFVGCTSLSEVVCPNYISGTYGDFSGAFSGCTGIRNVDFGALTLVNAPYTFGNAFNGCSNLESADFHSLSQITAASAFISAFYECRKLSSVNFNSLEYMAAGALDYAFYNCLSLTRVDFPQLRESYINTRGEVEYFDKTRSYMVDTFRGCANLTGVHFRSDIPEEYRIYFCGGLGITSTKVFFDL